MPIARVFPRKTNATPNDEYAFVGDVPLFLPKDITEIHVSCVFTWDKHEAERLAYEWENFVGHSLKIPVKLGGPAYDAAAEDFQAGMYLKKGYVITSRGCNNNCWFCLVPRREGKIRELPIAEGNNVLDNNLLQCSDDHIKAVFEMLAHQPNVQFTGGLEAAKLKEWHVAEMARVKTRSAFFAYDTPDDWEPLVEAAKLLKRATEWYRPDKIQCYVLCGYPNDTIEKAEKRCMDTLKLGYFPFAMYYRDPEGKQTKTKEWQNFQRLWTRQSVVNATLKKIGGYSNGS